MQGCDDFCNNMVETSSCNFCLLEVNELFWLKISGKRSTQRKSSCQRSTAEHEPVVCYLMLWRDWNQLINSSLLYSLVHLVASFCNEPWFQTSWKCIGDCYFLCQNRKVRKYPNIVNQHFGFRCITGRSLTSSCGEYTFLDKWDISRNNLSKKGYFGKLPEDKSITTHMFSFFCWWFLKLLTFSRENSLKNECKFDCK